MFSLDQLDAIEQNVVPLERYLFFEKNKAIVKIILRKGNQLWWKRIPLNNAYSIMQLE